MRRISSNQHFLFGAIAFLAVGIKLQFFRKYSNYFIPALLIYVSSSYIADDFIAIRSGLVTSLFLWAVIMAIEKRKLVFISIILLASSFHISALICFLIWPIVHLHIPIKKYIWLIPISYLVFLSGKGLGFIASYIQIPYVQSLFALYSEDEEMANVFSVTQLIRSAVCMFLIWQCRRVNLDHLHESMLKLYCFGISLYVLVTDVGAFSSRLSGLFLITTPYVIANIFYYTPSLKANTIRLFIVFFAYMCILSNIFNVLN